MIKFRCRHCNHEIGAEDANVGKDVKCGQCKSVNVIPSGFSDIASQAISDDMLNKDSHRFEHEETAGDTNDMPDLALIEDIEIEKPVLEDEDEPVTDPKADYIRAQVPPERTLPWPIDIFLYPFSIGGANFFGIAIGLPLLINLIIWWFERLGDAIPTFYLFATICIFLSFIIKIVILLYTFWYFCHCIRDSSEGSLRAPDVLAENPSIGELFGQILRMDLCFAMIASPVILYVSAPLKPFMPKIMFTWPFFLMGLTEGSPQSGAELYAFFIGNEVFFFTLVGISIFFLPMSWLATVMFDSIQGLNPITLIGSVFGTFFRYLPVAVVYYVPIVVMVVAVKFLIASSIPFLLSTLMLKILMAYLLTVNSHLLGRFYYLNQERLYWEV